MNEKNEHQDTCKHEIIWMNDERWFGIFPKRKIGLCKKCGKNFIKKEVNKSAKQIPK